MPREGFASKGRQPLAQCVGAQHGHERALGREMMDHFLHPTRAKPDDKAAIFKDGLRLAPMEAPRWGVRGCIRGKP